VRRKLGVIVVVPTVALLIAAVVGVNGQVERAGQASAVEDLADVGRQVTSLVHQLQRERDVTAGWVARGRTSEPADVAAQRAAVDLAAQAYAGAVDRLGGLGGQAGRLVANADTRLASLPVLRAALAETALPGEAGFAVYSSIVTDLLALIDEIGRATADRALAEPVRALDALARAKEFASQQRGVLYAVLSAATPRPEQLQDFRSAANQERGALTEFRSVASPGQRRRFEDTVTGPEVDQTEQVKAAAVAGQATRTLGGADSWLKTSTTKLDLMASVESTLLQDLAQASAAARDRTVRDVIGTVGLVLLAMLFAFAAMLLGARSLGRRLDALRDGALTVAHQRLPEVVAQLRDGPTALASIEVAPIDVTGADEVGEVARSFDAVHREAARLAGEQAQLRRDVNAVFKNLARRSQTLVQRQLTVLDELQRDEDDDDRLSQMFTVDHLATRMRRHGESLLVLAGDDSPRALSGPAPLADVLRAAAQEVEQYTRIDVADTDGVYIVGHAFTDLVHLLAELLENATTFSSPKTRVTVAGQRMPKDLGVLIEIEDLGVGMNWAQLADANARLSAPPTIDAAALNSMGLYVVGALAIRHGIDVRMRSSQAGGVLAIVQVPMRLLDEAPHHTVRAVTGIALATPTPPPADHTVEMPALRQAPAAPGTALAARPRTHQPALPANDDSWHSNASVDRGWRAAAASAIPSADGTTASGLPRLAPQANAVPGSVGRHAVPDPAPRDRAKFGALAAFQCAVEAGRDSHD